MNRYDVILKKQKVMVFLENKEIDLSGYEVITEGVYSLSTTQSLKENDPIRIDEEGMVVKADGFSDSIGFVMDPVKVLQRVQDQNIKNVKALKVGKPNGGFLHDHPGLQQQLGVDKDHVIVDRDHWARVRSALTGENVKFDNRISGPVPIIQRHSHYII